MMGYKIAIRVMAAGSRTAVRIVKNSWMEVASLVVPVLPLVDVVADAPEAEAVSVVVPAEPLQRRTKYRVSIWRKKCRQSLTC